LRLACCLLVERGIRICAPIHDAVLIEAPADEVDGAAADCQHIMAEASRIVLGGLALRTDAKVVHHPERYMDERVMRFWDEIMSILTEMKIA
jgi:hypothetical protein